jgi:dihydropteroate synthase
LKLQIIVFIFLFLPNYLNTNQNFKQIKMNFHQKNSPQINFPQIMGILNITPDSFSDGDKTNICEHRINIDFIEQKAKQLIDNGADIIDIGGESTRPDSDEVPVEAELARVLPTVKLIKTKFPQLKISIDTRKAEVAEESLKLGADIINDVSGLQYSPEIAEIVAKHNKEIVIMHSKDIPKNMQNNPQYENVVKEVFDFLSEKITFAKSKGVDKIWADIGIGFAKTTEHNIELLKNIKHFENLGIDLLLGISRKRFIGEITGITEPKERDTATMLIHSLLLHHPIIKIIRVHNVATAMQLKKVYSSLSL